MRLAGTLVLAAMLAGLLSWTTLEAETHGAGESAVVVIGKPASTPAPLWDEQLGKKLDSRLSVHFSGTPLREALAYLQEKGRLNTILNTTAAGVDPSFPIVLKLDDVTLKSAITWTARQAGLVYVARDEAVFVTTPADLGSEWAEKVRTRNQALDRLAEKTWIPDVKAKLQQPTSFSFENVALREVLAFFASRHQLNIVLDAEFARPDNTIPMMVVDQEMSARNALKWVLRTKHLEYILVDEALYVSSPSRLHSFQAGRRGTVGDPRFRTVVDVEFSEVPILKALEELSGATGLNISLRSDRVPAVTFTMKLDHVTLEDAIRELVDQTGLPFAFSFEDEGLVIWLQKGASAVMKPGEHAEPDAPSPEGE